MPTEIERKFLVSDSGWLDDVINEEEICQGYVYSESGCVCRFRIAGEKGFLTLKGDTDGISRPEFEYPIPVSDARRMIDLFCGDYVIEKKRYTLEYEGHIWEVDLFHGENAGLILAEVELQYPDEEFELPPWIDREVSHESRYYNAALARKNGRRKR